MKLNLPKVSTFWASVIIAVVGVIVYAIHVFAPGILYLGKGGFLLIVVAYALIFLGLTVKGL